MIFNSPRLRERQDGLDKFKELFRAKEKCLIIHYSCESFITSHGKTPRVTSICICNLSTNQTTSFSIHLQAQFDGKDFNNLTSNEYDELELKMLNEFSGFVKKNNTQKWLHWNMRDSNYGFEAINNRIRILKGHQFEIAEDFKFDIPRALGLIFTYGYEHNKPDGRLLNLANRNKISLINALTGAEEAKAFDQKEYLKLHLSTLRKVDAIGTIISRVENGTLRVATNKKDIYGLSIAGMVSVVKETPWLLLIMGVLGYLIGAGLEPIIQKIFHTAN